MIRAKNNISKGDAKMINYRSSKDCVEIFVINERIQVINNGKLVRDLYIPEKEFLEEELIETVEELNSHESAQVKSIKLRSMA